MAQETPNYKLKKPDASDPFGAFRQLFNDNMDKIDQIGGGGGSGGHTIVDENGSDMPAEGKLQFTGAASVTDDNGNGRTVVNVVACKKVTQAEYDALPASKLTDNIAYFIVDGESDEYKAKADKTDLASIQITGTVNDTGSTIASGTYFYLNGTLVRAIASISNGATLTLNTNYEEVTVGALNSRGMKVLWTNPSPTSPFISQNMNFSSSDYDLLIFVHSIYSQGSIIQKGVSGVAYLITALDAPNNIQVRSRNYTYVSDTVYTASDALISYANAGKVVNNGVMIPLKVYGIKL